VIGTGTRRRWQLPLTLLLTLACGGSIASKPLTSLPVAATEVDRTVALIPCPEDVAVPLVRRTRTVLPCLTDPGRLVRLAPGSGRAEVINMWASWCEPCRREVPLLQTAYQAAGNRVLFLGIDSRDDHGAALRFLRTRAVSYPQVFDSRGTVARDLGTPGVPYTVVVDASGDIVLRQIGELTDQALRGALARVGIP
jgi:cytochrome c biogenesis protein CcmG, thiol:disulfide interchange protein DsbE